MGFSVPSPVSEGLGEGFLQRLAKDFLAVALCAASQQNQASPTPWSAGDEQPGCLPWLVGSED